MATAELLMTWTDFAKLPHDGKVRELVEGRVVEMNVPNLRHGEVCINIASVLRQYVRAKGIGRVSGNDSGFVTKRNPDSVRGPDVCYFSVKRMPDAPLPEAYGTVAPEIVFEVLSPTDRWSDVIAKAGEYFGADVLVVCVVDTRNDTVTILRNDREPTILHEEDDFAVPDILGEFRVPVKEFFA